MIGTAPAVPVARRNSWGITIFLTLCFTLSYTDRHVLSLLVEPVKKSLQMSDTQMGVVQGLSFSIFYVLASLPLGRLADSRSRPRIISACMAFWCSMTMLCGAVLNVWQLLAARIGVAAAEAGLPPAALTMMADLNDQQRLASRTSVFMLAPFLGGGLALMGGGALYGAVQSWGVAQEPWRLVFVLVGAPGLLAAAAVLKLQEPRSSSDPAGRKRGFGPLWAFLKSNALFNALYLLTMAMLVILLNANVSWMPAVLMRAHHMDAKTTGLLFGPVFLIFGIVGTLAAGALISRSTGSVIRRTFKFMRACMVLALPAAAIGPLAPSLWLLLPLVALTLLCTSSVLALSSLPFLVIAPGEVRAQALAFLALVTALVGTGLGPLLVGVLSDLLPAAHQPLPMALAIVGSAAALLALLMLNGLVRRSERFLQ